MKLSAFSTILAEERESNPTGDALSGKFPLLSLWPDLSHTALPELIEVSRERPWVVGFGRLLDARVGEEISILGRDCLVPTLEQGQASKLCWWYTVRNGRVHMGQSIKRVSVHTNWLSTNADWKSTPLCSNFSKYNLTSLSRGSVRIRND